MNDHAMHRRDSNPLIPSAGPRLPARLRRQRALLVPPSVPVESAARVTQ